MLAPAAPLLAALLFAGETAAPPAEPRVVAPERDDANLHAVHAVGDRVWVCGDRGGRLALDRRRPLLGSSARAHRAAPAGPVVPDGGPRLGRRRGDRAVHRGERGRRPQNRRRRGDVGTHRHDPAAGGRRGPVLHPGPRRRRLRPHRRGAVRPVGDGRRRRHLDPPPRRAAGALAGGGAAGPGAGRAGRRARSRRPGAGRFDHRPPRRPGRAGWLERGDARPRRGRLGGRGGRPRLAHDLRRPGVGAGPDAPGTHPRRRRLAGRLGGRRRRRRLRRPRRLRPDRRRSGRGKRPTAANRRGRRGSRGRRPR